MEGLRFATGRGFRVIWGMRRRREERNARPLDAGHNGTSRVHHRRGTRRPQNQGMCCGESRVEVFPQRAGNFSGVAGNLFRNLFVVVSEDGENLAVMRKAKIRQYGIAVIQRFCYNFRHESNHADPR